MTPPEGILASDEASAGASAAASSESWRVRLGSFEGPLDLLLHLVRVNEFDIADLPIVTITQQYHAYLDMMRDLNLEVAGEYLVMAATLVHIKSRTLLPPDPSSPGEEASADPRAELSEQLIEYQRYKQAAENLHALDSVRSLIWTRDGRVPDEFVGEELLAVELYDLLGAFKKLLHRLGEEERLLLKRDDVSVADKIAWLTDRLEESASIDLLELLAGLESRIERIAVFLALLEMIRLQMAVAFQRATFGDIRIGRRADFAGGVVEAEGRPESTPPADDDPEAASARGPGRVGSTPPDGDTADPDAEFFAGREGEEDDE